MKDLPHHIKKLNRRIIRSIHREEMEEDKELPEVPTWPETKRAKRKKEKIKMRKEREERVPSDLSPEERNKIKRKGRVPVFDRNNGEPKHTRSSKKKTPRI